MKKQYKPQFWIDTTEGGYPDVQSLMTGSSRSSGRRRPNRDLTIKLSMETKPLDQEAETDIKDFVSEFFLEQGWNSFNEDDFKIHSAIRPEVEVIYTIFIHPS